MNYTKFSTIILLIVFVFFNMGCKDSINESPLQTSANNVKSNPHVNIIPLDSIKNLKKKNLIQTAPANNGVGVELAIGNYSIVRHLDGGLFLLMTGYSWFCDAPYGDNFDTISKLGFHVLYFYDNDNVADAEEDIWVDETTYTYPTLNHGICFEYEIGSIPNNVKYIRYYAMVQYGSSTTGPAPLKTTEAPYIYLYPIDATLSGPTSLQIQSGLGQSTGTYSISFSGGPVDVGFDWSIIGPGDNLVAAAPGYIDTNRPQVVCYITSGFHQVKCVINDKWGCSITKIIDVNVQ